LTSVIVRPLEQSDVPLCEGILAGLPAWFGIREANERYIRDLSVYPSYVAASGDRIVGFASIHHHNAESAELHILAVSKHCHRRGIGRLLLQRIEDELLRAGTRLLQVKTLGPSDGDEGYTRTRAFYLAMGFIPLEETTAYWGEENPTLIMVKPLA
jgi:GNAT superfamily N-acetyltransferase